MSSSKRRRSRSPPEEGEIPSSQYCSRSDDSMRTRSDRFNSHSLLQCERLRATARLEKEASQESPKHEEGEIDNESSKSKRPMEVDGSAIASDKRTKTSTDIPLPPGWIKVFSESQQTNYYCHPLTDHTQWHQPTTSEVRDPAMAKNRLQQATATATVTEVERVKENARLDTERLELENKQLRLDTENAIWLEEKARLENNMARLDTERLELENKQLRLVTENAIWLEEKARLENDIARLNTERLELENNQLRLVTKNATNDVERLKLVNEKLQ